MYIDTHVAVWLYEALLDRFPDRTKTLIENNDLFISPMAVLELRFLQEIDRISVEASVIVEYLESAVDLQVCRLPFYRIVMESLNIQWTRDPFDRIIVAHAVAGQEGLLTKDQTLHHNTDVCLWD